MVLLAELLPRRIRGQVGDVVGQRAADQKFQRQIINPFGVALLVGLLGLEPALRKHVAHGTGDGFKLVAGGESVRRQDLVEGEVPLVKGVCVFPKISPGRSSTLRARFLHCEDLFADRAWVRFGTMEVEAPALDGSGLNVRERRPVVRMLVCLFILSTSSTGSGFLVTIPLCRNSVFHFKGPSSLFL